MKYRFPRLAARAIILDDARLLLVNAYAPSRGSDLWCAPGGGVDVGRSIPENLVREVYEETGLTISVGPMALVNEFHSPKTGFHQVDLYFRCEIAKGDLDPEWVDPEGIVTQRRFFSRDELDYVRFKPDSLPDVAFAAEGPAHYDPLEEIIL